MKKFFSVYSDFLKFVVTRFYNLACVLLSIEIDVKYAIVVLLDKLRLSNKLLTISW